MVNHGSLSVNWTGRNLCHPLPAGEGGRRSPLEPGLCSVAAVPQCPVAWLKVSSPKNMCEVEEKTNPKRPGSPQAQINKTKKGPTRDSQPRLGSGWPATEGWPQVLSGGDLNRRTKEEAVRRQLKPRRDLEVERGLERPCGGWCCKGPKSMSRPSREGISQAVLEQREKQMYRQKQEPWGRDAVLPVRVRPERDRLSGSHFQGHSVAPVTFLR